MVLVGPTNSLDPHKGFASYMYLVKLAVFPSASIRKLSINVCLSVTFF